MQFAGRPRWYRWPLVLLAVVGVIAALILAVRFWRIAVPLVVVAGAVMFALAPIRWRRR